MSKEWAENVYRRKSKKREKKKENKCKDQVFQYTSAGRICSEQFQTDNRHTTMHLQPRNPLL